MNYEKLVQGILNIGEAMLQCGAEILPRGRQSVSYV